jgi:hypothetical protein
MKTYISGILLTIPMAEEQSILEGMARLYIGVCRQKAGRFYSGAFYEKSADGTFRRTADALITCDNLNDVVVRAAQQKGVDMYIINQEPVDQLEGKEYLHFTAHGYAALNPFEMRDAKTVMREIRNILTKKHYRKSHKQAPISVQHEEARF